MFCILVCVPSVPVFSNDPSQISKLAKNEANSMLKRLWPKGVMVPKRLSEKWFGAETSVSSSSNQIACYKTFFKNSSDSVQKKI